MLQQAGNILCLLLSLVVLRDSRAADLQVPRTYPTIQSAIVAAANGDQILVQPGTYHERIDFMGKDLRVVGVAGAGFTTIDGTSLPGSVVSFISGEPSTALLKGFRITGGTGQSGTMPFEIFNFGGGGIMIRNSADPHIDACFVEGNSVQSPDPLLIYPAVGGGVYSQPNYEPQGPLGRLTNCIIRGNHAEGWGGGVVGSLLSMENCLIDGNSAGENGGGVAFVQDMKNCTFTNNSAGADGGGYWGSSLSDCSLFGNSAGGYGGAAYLYRSGFVGEPPSIASHVLSANNSAPVYDGIYCNSNYYFEVFGTLVYVGTGVVTHCTVYGDRVASSSSVENTIIANPPDPLQLPKIVNYNCIQGAWTGGSESAIGNVSADPLLVDGSENVLQLLPGSPCIDAASPASPADPDGSPADMGALPASPWINLGQGLEGSWGVCHLAGSGPLVGGQDVTFSLTQGPPNAVVYLVMGFTALNVPFHGGLMVPQPDFILRFPTNAAGEVSLSGHWPAGIASGSSFYFQMWYQDPGNPKGFAASNGLQILLS